MNQYMHRAAVVLARVNELALISDDRDCITRTFCSPAFLEARTRVFSWMQQAGLTARVDNIGNLRGRLESPDPGAKTLVIASHIDSVINAGKFDGPLGIIIGLDLLENLLPLKSSLPFNIELIAFCDEEGVRFHTTFLGSKVVAGTFENALLDRTDASGVSLGDVIIGTGGISELLRQDSIPRSEWLGYFEIHIEQGPVLYETDIPVAVVSSIAGQQRFEISFEGVAGHAGTVPMSLRHDALCCAAEFIVETEKYAAENLSTLVATVGKLHIPNAASNVIPGKVICSLDCRSADQKRLESALVDIRRKCEQISIRRGVHCEWLLIQKTGPVACDAALNTLLLESTQDSGIACVSLVSGAGHDAVPVSEIAPVCMLFVRCFKGISHNPSEDVEMRDIAAAVQVSEGFIHKLIQANKKT